MTTITAVAELVEVEASPRRSRRGRDLAVIISIGIAEAAWCAGLGWALWTLVL